MYIDKRIQKLLTNEQQLINIIWSVYSHGHDNIMFLLRTL